MARTLQVAKFLCLDCRPGLPSDFKIKHNSFVSYLAIAGYHTIHSISLLYHCVFSNLVCNVGYVKDDGSSPPLSNFTCSEKQFHTLTTYHNDSIEYQYSLHNPEGAARAFRDVDYCLAFLASGKDSIDFMCDYHYVCDNVTNHEGFTPGFVYGGSAGTLFCCSNSECNSVDIIIKLKQVENSCYVTNSSSNATVMMQCPTSHCINQTFFDSESGSVSKHICSCDEKNFCVNKPNSCQNKTSPDGVTYSVCCCTGAGCNQFTPISRVSMVNPEQEQQTRRSHSIMIGGIVASVMFTTLVFIIVALVIRKYKQRKQEQLSFTYAQLTADLAEPDTTDACLMSADPRDPDEQLIIG